VPLVKRGHYSIYKKSTDASSGKWEDQVTSGYFDSTLREANFELEHVLMLRLMTFHESTRAEKYAQERILRNADRPVRGAFRCSSV